MATRPTGCLGPPPDLSINRSPFLSIFSCRLLAGNERTATSATSSWPLARRFVERRTPTSPEPDGGLPQNPGVSSRSRSRMATCCQPSGVIPKLPQEGVRSRLRIGALLLGLAELGDCRRHVDLLGRVHRLDVAQDVKIELVPLDLAEAHHPRVLGYVLEGVERG